MQAAAAEESPEEATTLEVNISTPVFLPAGTAFETYAAVCRLAQDAMLQDSLLFGEGVKVNWKLEFTALTMAEDMASQMVAFALERQVEQYAAIMWVFNGADAAAISRIMNRREVWVRRRLTESPDASAAAGSRCMCPRRVHVAHLVCAQHRPCDRFRTSFRSASSMPKSPALLWNFEMRLFFCGPALSWSIS